jgi:DtxR family transcriptional regulator, Mn-dependent transcriptional regulator
MNLTPAIQDYLKIIYDLTSQHGRASTKEIATALAIKPASVTGMIQKLAVADKPLVEYKKHYGVSLTAEGERAALEIIRSHRLLEQFLHETLGFPWDEVHAEAHRLEHVISDKFVERMAAVLGHPEYDPHGAPIPSRDLEIPATTSLCLGDLTVGQRAVIRQVPDDDPELLRYLGEHGVVPNAVLVVLEILPFDGNLKIQVEGQSEPVVLGPSITCEIFVEMV